MIDTHIHLDGEEFANDRDEVIARAKTAGVRKMLVPAIDLPTSKAVIALADEYPEYIHPMIGLHPEEVKADWQQEVREIEKLFREGVVAIGEVGLDYYWSREYEQEQIRAFEAQVIMAVEHHLPLMIHCRKAQNELVNVLKHYEKDLCGGVFHCFTGNAQEAAELLRFNGFALGIGGVLTFKKSKLPEVIKDIPLSRIVLETDAPYMAPVPMRGKRNESAFLTYVVDRLAEVYEVSSDEVKAKTTANACSIFLLNNQK